MSDENEKSNDSIRSEYLLEEGDRFPDDPLEDDQDLAAMREELDANGDSMPEVNIILDLDDAEEKSGDENTVANAPVDPDTMLQVKYRNLREKVDAEAAEKAIRAAEKLDDADGDSKITGNGALPANERDLDDEIGDFEVDAPAKKVMPAKAKKRASRPLHRDGSRTEMGKGDRGRRERGLSPPTFSRVQNRSKKGKKVKNLKKMEVADGNEDGAKSAEVNAATGPSTNRKKKVKKTTGRGGKGAKPADESKTDAIASGSATYSKKAETKRVDKVKSFDNGMEKREDPVENLDDNIDAGGSDSADSRDVGMGFGMWKRQRQGSSESDDDYVRY